MIFKKDKYRTARGGHSRLIKVDCSNCKQNILLYQKDGAGPLKRLYLDCILDHKLARRLKIVPSKKIPNLKCQKCGSVVGSSYIYEKENREAVRLFAYCVSSKITRVSKEQVNKRLQKDARSARL